MTVLELSDATTSIDYTAYGFVYTPDHEQGGLRVRQGDGTLAVGWDRLDRLSVTRVGEQGAEAEMVTHAGEKLSVTLVPWSKQGLNGSTSLGQFSIALSRLRTIEVVR